MAHKKEEVNFTKKRVLRHSLTGQFLLHFLSRGLCLLAEAAFLKLKISFKNTFSPKREHLKHFY